MRIKKYLSMLLIGAATLATLNGCGAKSSAQENDESVENTQEQVEISESSEEVPAASEITSESDRDAEYQPVEIENFDQTISFEKKPEHVVVLTLNSAEIIAALGEADSIVGIAKNANEVEDVLPELYDSLKDCAFPEEINDGIPTLEGMLSLEPDLVVANSYYFNVPQMFGTMEDYSNNGVTFYITEGSYVSDCTIENTYNDIRNIGAIYGKPEEAEKLITNMKEKIDKVGETVSGQSPLSVMSFDSFDEDGFTVSGGTGLVQNLIELAGGKNAFEDSDKQFAKVNIEEIISRNPDVIVIHAYTAYGDEDTQAKVDKLMNTPELAEVSAVKNNNIVIVPLFQVNPSLQNANYVETVASVMYPELFN